MEPVRIGIMVICDRYRTCAGGKCLRALRNREGAFSVYAGREVELVGYPPCPHLAFFKRYLEEQRGLRVVVGTHPIPQKYLKAHTRLATWQDPGWKELLEPTLAEEAARLAYD